MRHSVHPINERRNDLGLYATLVQELRVDDTGRHSQYMRMMVENFDIILGLVEPHLRRQDTVMRLAIESALKLAVTLHHLAEGASDVAIAAHYRLGRSTVSLIIYETWEALWTVSHFCCDIYCLVFVNVWPLLTYIDALMYDVLFLPVITCCLMQCIFSLDYS